MNCLKAIQSDLFASGADDSLVMLWNLTTNQMITYLKWHSGPVTALETFYGTVFKTNKLIYPYYRSK